MLNYAWWSLEPLGSSCQAGGCLYAAKKAEPSEENNRSNTNQSNHSNHSNHSRSYSL